MQKSCKNNKKNHRKMMGKKWKKHREIMEK